MWICKNKGPTCKVQCISFATEAHLGSGELLRAASLREVVRESKARSQRFPLLLFLFVYWRCTSYWLWFLFALLVSFLFSFSLPYECVALRTDFKINCHEPITVTARPIRNKLVRNKLTTFWGNDAGCQPNLFQAFYSNAQFGRRLIIMRIPWAQRTGEQTV